MTWRVPLVHAFPVAEDVIDLCERGLFKRLTFFGLGRRDEVSHLVMCELTKLQLKLCAAGGWAAIGKHVEKQVQDQAVSAEGGREGRHGFRLLLLLGRFHLFLSVGGAAAASEGHPPAGLQGSAGGHPQRSMTP
jgi:hypothetical protein